MNMKDKVLRYLALKSNMYEARKILSVISKENRIKYLENDTMDVSTVAKQICKSVYSDKLRVPRVAILLVLGGICALMLAPGFYHIPFSVIDIVGICMIVCLELIVVRGLLDMRPSMIKKSIAKMYDIEDNFTERQSEYVNAYVSLLSELESIYGEKDSLRIVRELSYIDELRLDVLVPISERPSLEDLLKRVRETSFLKACRALICCVIIMIVWDIHMLLSSTVSVTPMLLLIAIEALSVHICVKGKRDKRRKVLNIINKK